MPRQKTLLGKRQACDPLFERWEAAGQLTESKRWQRLKLASEARNYSLGSHIANQLPTLSKQGALLVEVAQNPLLLKQTARFTPATAQMADIVSLGLRRLARQDPLALYYWTATP
jgi:soluble lytic murein transglycosylase